VGNFTHDGAQSVIVLLQLSRQETGHSLRMTELFTPLLPTQNKKVYICFIYYLLCESLASSYYEPGSPLFYNSAMAHKNIAPIPPGHILTRW